MAQETETLDKPDPQWPLLVLDLVNAIERLEEAKKEVLAAEQDVRTTRITARHVLSVNKKP